MHIFSHPRYALVALLLATPLSGCAHPWHAKTKHAKYRTVQANGRHDTKTARIKHTEAVQVLEKVDKACCLLYANLEPAEPGPSEKHLAKAEALLQEALVADVTYGPAHNTLGMVYFLQDKLYLAAWEFEYAAKLMPEYAEPYNNLGLVYEHTGKYEDAISYYSQAMIRDSNNPEVMGNLVRARLINGEKTADIKTMISDLALYHPDPEWQKWARDQVELAKFEGVAATEAASSPLSTDAETLPAPKHDRDTLPPPGPQLRLPESVTPES